MSLALEDILEAQNHLELWAKSKTVPTEARAHLILSLVEITKAVEIIKKGETP